MKVKRDIVYPGSGFAQTISSGMFSSSQGGRLFSLSRELIFITTAFKSSTAAVARGSIVFTTQLVEVRNFSEYLDTSDADISIQSKKI